MQTSYRSRVPNAAAQLDPRSAVSSSKPLVAILRKATLRPEGGTKPDFAQWVSHRSDHLARARHSGPRPSSAARRCLEPLGNDAYLARCCFYREMVGRNLDDTCELHQWVAKAVTTGERWPDRLFRVQANAECRTCTACEAVLEMARSAALSRAIVRPLRFGRPIEWARTERRYRIEGLNVAPTP